MDKPQHSETAFTLADLNTEQPRWCAGCGDYGILTAVKKFMVSRQLLPHLTVHVSGIGCSGRVANYIHSYGIHSLHGRAIPVALGLVLTRPDLKVFIHVGDGDLLSIGGNHFLHGLNKNFNCVLVMYDNEIYALTKSQTSPTTRQGHKTNTQPAGSLLAPINPIQLSLGMGASFVASTADWLPGHMAATLEAAYDHKGFSFIHVCQRCPHFDPHNFAHKETAWFSFLQHTQGIAPEARLADKVEMTPHDPADLQAAFARAREDRRYFGLFYRNADKPCYDETLRRQLNTPQQDSGVLFEEFRL